MAGINFTDEQEYAPKLSFKNNEVLPCVSRSFIGLFMHFDNGDMVNIQDLPKPEYEDFLEQMNALRMAYITLVSRP